MKEETKNKDVQVHRFKIKMLGGENKDVQVHRFKIDSFKKSVCRDFKQFIAN